MKTPKKPARENPPYDPDRYYHLFGHGKRVRGKYIEADEREIVEIYTIRYGQPPEYIRCDAGGWTLGYIPDAAVKRRVEK